MSVYVIVESTPDGPAKPVVFAGDKAGGRTAMGYFCKRVLAALREQRDFDGARQELTAEEMAELLVEAKQSRSWTGWDHKIEFFTCRVRDGKAAHAGARR